MKKIIQRPHITEKSMTQAQKGWFAFVASRFARKEAIAKAVSAMYNVNVLDVRTALMPGKKQRRGKKMITITKTDWKKAFVRLEKGQTIPVFEMTESQNTGK